EAARRFREAIELYAALPENAGTANNSALAHTRLYFATGEREALDKSITLQEKAVSLQPRDSILLANLADNVKSRALTDVIGASLDLPRLRHTGSFGLLSYLYANNKEWSALRERLRQHAGLAKARQYAEQVQVLAPKQPTAYAALLSVYQHVHDVAALRR